MESKFTDNEVREIARMQELIDYYELALQSMYLIARNNCNINFPQFSDSPNKHEINFLFRWVKERKSEEMELKSR